VAEDIQIVVSARDEASQTLKRIDQDGLQSMATSATQAGVALSAFAAGGALAIRSAADSFISFETGLNEVNTLLSEGSKPISEFKNELLDLSTRVPDSLKNLTGGLYDIISASVDSAEAMGALELASKAAVAGISDTKTAADLGTTVMNAYGKEVGELENIFDIVFTTIKKGKTTFPELAQSMGRILPFATATGTSFEEVSAALATLTRSGIQTPIAATAIGSALGGLLKPTKGVQDAMKALDVNLKDTSGNFIGLVELVKQFKEKNLTQEDIAKLFPNKRALTGILTLMKQYDGFLVDVAAAQNATGATATAFDKVMAGLGPTFDLLKNNLKVLTLTFFEDLVPAFQKSAVVITSATKVLQSIPAPIRKIITIGASLSVILAGVSGAFLLLVGRIPMIVSGMKLLASAFAFIPTLASILTTAIAPISLALLGLIPVALAVYGAFKNWDAIKNVFKNLVSQAGSAIQYLEQAFWAWIDEIRNMSFTLGSIFTTAFVQVKDVVEAGMAVITAAMGGNWELALFHLRDFWEKFKRLMSTSWAAIKEILSDPELLSKFVAALKIGFQKATPVIQKLLSEGFKKAMKAASTILKASGGTILDVMESVLKALPGIIKDGGSLVIAAFKTLWSIVTGTQIDSGPLSSTISELFTRFKAIIAENAPPIKQAIKDLIVEAFGEDALINITIFKDTVYGTLTDIKNFFTSDAGGFAIFKETVTTTLADLRIELEALKIFFTPLKDAIVTTFNEIDDFLTKQDGIEILRETWNETIEDIKTGLEVIGGLVTGGLITKGALALGTSLATIGATATASTATVAATGAAATTALTTAGAAGATAATGIAATGTAATGVLSTLGPAAALVGAGFAGWKAGEALNEVQIGSRKAKDYITDFFTAIGAGGTYATVSLRDTSAAVQQQGEAVKEVAENAKQVETALRTADLTLPPPDFTSIDAGLAQLNTSAQAAFEKTKATVRTSIAEINQAIRTGLSGGNPFAELPNQASTAMQEVTTSISTSLETIKTTVADIAVQIGESFTVDFTTIDFVAPFSEKISTLSTVVTTAMVGVQEAFGTTFDSIVLIVTEKVTLISTSIVELLSGLPEQLAVAFEGLTVSIGTTLEAISSTFQTGFTTMFEIINEVVVSNMENVGALIQEGLLSTFERVTEILLTLPEVFSEAFAGVSDAITGPLDAIKLAMTELAAQIVGAVPEIQSAVSSINAELAKLGDVQASTESASQLIHLIEGILKEAQNVIEAYVPQFQTYGEAIMNSFAAGMEKAGARIIKAAAAAVSQAKRILESNSPPKEGPLRNIDKWGYNVMDSFAEGMANAAPRVLDMVEASIPNGNYLQIAPVPLEATSSYAPTPPSDTSGSGATEVHHNEFNITLPGLVVRSEDDAAMVKAIVAQAIDEAMRRGARV